MGEQVHADLSGDPCALFRRCIGNHQDTCPHVGTVSPWKSVNDRDRQDVGLGLFEGPDAVDDRADRLLSRMKNGNHPTVENGLNRFVAAVHDPDQKVRHLDQAFFDIRVRVFLVAADGVRILQHLL